VRLAQAQNDAELEAADGAKDGDDNLSSLGDKEEEVQQQAQVGGAGSSTSGSSHQPIAVDESDSSEDETSRKRQRVSTQPATPMLDPNDDLAVLLAQKVAREAARVSMKATVHVQMKTLMDTGVRVNPELAQIYGVSVPPSATGAAGAGASSQPLSSQTQPTSSQPASVQPTFASSQPASTPTLMAAPTSAGAGASLLPSTSQPSTLQPTSSQPTPSQPASIMQPTPASWQPASSQPASAPTLTASLTATATAATPTSTVRDALAVLVHADSHFGSIHSSLGKPSGAGEALWMRPHLSSLVAPGRKSSHLHFPERRLRGVSSAILVAVGHV
jgi:hypothetical protein